MGSYTCLQSTLGTAVTEDRLLPSTVMHLGTDLTSAQLFALQAKQPEPPQSPRRQVCQPSGCPHSHPGRSPSSLPGLDGASPPGPHHVREKPEDLRRLARGQAGSTPGAGSSFTRRALAACQSTQCSRSPVLGQVCAGTRGAERCLAPCACPPVGRGAGTALPTTPRLRGPLGIPRSLSHLCGGVC